MHPQNSSRNTLAGLAILCAALGGCTSVNVKPVSADHRIEHICIQDNPRVQVGDFVSVMQEGFQKHGITSHLFRDDAPAKCLYTSTYTARRTWDMAMYMTDAQIDILRDGRQIAFANYHLKGRGGLSLMKWASTREKILPVIDQLLAQVEPSSHVAAGRPGEPMAAPAAAPAVVSTTAANPPSSELARKLSELKDAYDAELITKEEYDLKRKALIAEL
jgi:hypothetical protein